MATKRPRKKPASTELAARVRHLVALDAANLMARLSARHEPMVSLFSRLRDRSPMLQTIHSLFLSVSFGELAALEPFEQNAANQFYSLVGELRWYLQYTEDMPALVRTKVTNFVRLLREAHLKLTAIIGPPDSDGAPVVEGVVVVEAAPAQVVDLDREQAVSTADRSPNLLAWQWAGYPDFHGSRKNLLLHALTNPLFLFGTLGIASVPLTRWHCGVGGLLLMALVMAVQGRGHKLEKNLPIPFEGPLDVIGRILLEQWVNFPRFVLTGGFSRLEGFKSLKPLAPLVRAGLKANC